MKNREIARKQEKSGYQQNGSRTLDFNMALNALLYVSTLLAVSVYVVCITARCGALIVLLPGLGAAVGGPGRGWRLAG